MEVGFDGRVQPGRFGLLLPPLRGETDHLLLEWFAVVLLGFHADVASGRENVAVLARLFQIRALAETGNVGVLLPGLFLLSPPGVVGVGDTADVLVGQLAVGTVDHPAHLAGVDKQYLARPVPV